MRGRKKAFILLLMGLLWLYGCGSPSLDSEVMTDIAEESELDLDISDFDIGEELVYERSIELQYAENSKQHLIFVRTSTANQYWLSFTTKIHGILLYSTTLGQYSEKEAPGSYKKSLSAAIPASPRITVF